MMRFAVSLGAGIQHVVKSKEKMVVNLEYAQGKSDNYGSPCSSDTGSEKTARQKE